MLSPSGKASALIVKPQLHFLVCSTACQDVSFWVNCNAEDRACLRGIKLSDSFPSVTIPVSQLPVGTCSAHAPSLDVVLGNFALLALSKVHLYGQGPENNRKNPYDILAIDGMLQADCMCHDCSCHCTILCGGTLMLQSQCTVRPACYQTLRGCKHAGMGLVRIHVTCLL